MFQLQKPNENQTDQNIPRNNRIKSNVWNLFELIIDKSTEDQKIVSNFVRCSSCLKYFSYNGQTTSTLLRHIECGREQPSIRIFLAQKQPLKVKQIDINNVRDASIKFIVKDLRPYAAIEGDGLIELCQSMVQLGQRYPNMSNDDVKKILPTRKTLSSDVLKRSTDVCNQISNDMRDAINFAGGFSCTSDLWTDNFKRKSYLCITAHLNLFQDEKIVPKMYLINMNAMDDEPKKGTAIFAEMTKIFQKFGLTSDEIIDKITFITDRGGNMKAGLTDCVRLNCYAHIINNIVQKMCKLDHVNGLITKAASLVRYMKITGLNDNEQLVSSLKSYCETRFNTVVDMFESIERNYYEIFNLLREKQQKTKQTNLLTKITCLDDGELKLIIDFLKIFKEITTDIEGDEYITIIKVWPAYLKIVKHLLPKENDSSIVSAMKNEGRGYMENKTEIEPNMIHKVAVFLHPAFKNLGFADLQEQQEIHSYTRSKIGSGSVMLDDNANESMNSRAADTPRHNNSSLFDELLDNVEEEFNGIPVISDEVQFYIDLKIAKVHFTIY